MGPLFLPFSPRIDKQSRSKRLLILVNDGTPPEMTKIHQLYIHHSLEKYEKVIRYLYWN